MNHAKHQQVLRLGGKSTLFISVEAVTLKIPITAATVSRAMTIIIAHSFKTIPSWATADPGPRNS